MTDGLLLEDGGRKVKCLPQRHTGWLWLRQGQKEGCLVLPRHKKAFLLLLFSFPPSSLIKRIWSPSPHKLPVLHAGTP